MDYVVFFIKYVSKNRIAEDTPVKNTVHQFPHSPLV